MNRREFLSNISRKTSALAAASVITAVTFKHKSIHVAEKSTALIDTKLKEIQNRLDKMDRNYKRTVRAFLAFGAISTGVDLTILI